MKKILLIVGMLLISSIMFADIMGDIENDERLQEIGNLFQTGESDQQKLGFEKLDIIIEETPQYEPALYLRALMLILRTDNLDAAFKDMKVISDIREKPISIYVEIVGECISIRKPEKARSVLDVAQPLFPESGEFYLFYGLVEYFSDNPEKAIYYSQKALEIKPDSADILAFLKAVYYEECENPEVDYLQRSKYFVEIANISRDLEEEEEMIKAAYFAKAFGNDSAQTSLSIEHDPGYVLQLEKFPFPFPVGGSYTFKVYSTSEYEFTIKIKEKTSAGTAFEWEMSTSDDMKGEVVMDSTALQQATKLFNYFKAGEKTMLSDMTSVWVSNKVYNALKNNESIKIDTGFGDRTFRSVGNEPCWFVSNDVAVEVDAIRAESEEETVVTEDGTQSEIIYILDDPDNPMILQMQLNWSIFFESAELPVK